MKITIQIADALEKAHRAGVVHRDLTPGNVMLTKSGAKLLGFGLAKPVSAQMTAGSSVSQSVFTAAMTQSSPAASPAVALSAAGLVVGTAQYMSPEQVQGLTPACKPPLGQFDVTRDGKKFLVNSVNAEGGSNPLTMVTNWMAELQKMRAAAGCRHTPAPFCETEGKGGQPSIH